MKQSQSSDMSSMLLQLKFQSLRTQYCLKNAGVTMCYRGLVLLLKPSVDEGSDPRGGSPGIKPLPLKRGPNHKVQMKILNSP